MKLLGLSCGQKMGNCEILLKEALIGAEELGAEVEFMRLMDLDIKPCIFCQPCPAMSQGMEACIYKDDAAFFMEKFLDCDGFIISAPVYTLTPPGQLFVIRDRLLGPKVDVALVKQWENMADAPKFDKRRIKNRSGGFISVGGAPQPDWVTLGVPLLHTLTFSPQIAIVDQVQFRKIAAAGAAALYEDVLERARLLGRRVAENMGKPFDDVEYAGDEPGTCPVCHNDLMIVGKESPIRCAICGMQGEITVENGKITVVFSEEERRKSHLTFENKQFHGQEVMEVGRELAPRKDEIPEKVKKYQAYKSPLKPPSKE